MTNDNAAFRPQDIEAVWGPRPHCVLTTLWEWCDATHILGRGYNLGIRPADEDRKVLGSIFNCAPLNRDIHKGPRRDHPDFRRFLLNVVGENVFEAIGNGAYEMKEVDREFLKLAVDWLKQNSPTSE